MKKYTYDIGDWVIMKYTSKKVGVIIDQDIDGVGVTVSVGVTVCVVVSVGVSVGV